MATKWADYLISAVRYNASGSHIDKVRAHPDNGDSIGSGSDMARSRVVTLLESGWTFCTILKSADGKWRRGADIRVVIIEGEKFIKTEPDRTKKDNLGELPRF